MRINEGSSQHLYRHAAGPVEQSRQMDDMQKRTQEMMDDQEALPEQPGEEENMLERELQEMVERINKVTGNMNISLQFELHEQSDRWMVEVIDTVENEVLKEIPPEKLLDLYGRIRELIGMFVDETR